jgi:hypothetical protein
MRTEGFVSWDLVGDVGREGRGVTSLDIALGAKAVVLHAQTTCRVWSLDSGIVAHGPLMTSANLQWLSGKIQYCFHTPFLLFFHISHILLHESAASLNGSAVHALSHKRPANRRCVPDSILSCKVPKTLYVGSMSDWTCRIGEARRRRSPLQRGNISI